MNNRKKPPRHGVIGTGHFTTRKRLIAGGRFWAIPGGLQTAGDHLAGGNTLPPAVCKPPGVSLVSVGCLCKTPGILFTAGGFKTARDKQ